MSKTQVWMLIWLIVSAIIAAFNMPKIDVRINGKGKGFKALYFLIAWIIIFVLPLFVFWILALAGVVVVAGLSFVGVVLLIAAVIGLAVWIISKFM